MEVKIKAIHFEISEHLAEFINKKADKLAKRNPNVTEFEFSLKVVKPETAMNKEAIVKVIVPQQDDIVASKVADTFEEAVDVALEAIDKQLERKKHAK